MAPARCPAAPRPRPPPKLCKVGPRPHRPRPRLTSEARLAAAAAPRGGGGAAAAASKRPNSRGLGGSHALRSVMSAEQEKDPISLKRVRGNREGRRVEGSGGSGARGGRVPAGREATGLCPGLTPRSPRPACAPGPGLRSEARGRRVPCAEPWPPRLCVRRQLKPHSASLHTPLLAHLTSLARHSTIGSSEGEKETPPGRDHERCPPPPPPKK